MFRTGSLLAGLAVGLLVMAARAALDRQYGLCAFDSAAAAIALLAYLVVS